MRRIASMCFRESPTSSSVKEPASLLSTRMESFSPLSTPALATRKEAVAPSLRAMNPPSCGRRRSEMSMPETALMLLMTARAVASLTSFTVRRTPSMRSRTVYVESFFGSIRMSLARRSRALAMVDSVRSRILASAWPLLPCP